MNKTLLLILCDFLLLTILSMWKMEEDSPPPSETNSDSGGESIAAMAMMEQDLLETLKYSLDEEKSETEKLAESLDEKLNEIQQKEEVLAQKEQSIRNLEQTLTEAEERELALQREKESLAGKTEKLTRTTEDLSKEIETSQSNYDSLSEQLAETALEARQGAAQSQMLQEELNRKLAEIEKKEADLAEASRKLASAQQEVQELNVQVQVSQQENKFLSASVASLKGEITAERAERQALQEQAGVLAEGVSQLAESSQDLREELRSSFEINANQLFSDFKSNQVLATFASLTLNRNRYVETNTNAASVVVSDGHSTYALMHIDSGPFGLKTNPALTRSMSLGLSRRGNTVSVSKIQFLSLDPRIMAIPLTSEQVDLLGGSVYYTALEPFKFPEAVLVTKKGDYYGEVDFKLDSDTPGFVKMQTKIFSSIFGEFSPSTGDLVLSKTGELLGIMVNRRYCVLIDNFLVEASLDVGGTMDKATFGQVLRQLNNALDTFPEPLQ